MEQPRRTVLISKQNMTQVVEVEGDPTGLCPPGKPDCTQAKPLLSNTSKCDAYKDEPLYKGAGLKCFCQCAGGGDWAKQVRGCLACEFERGTDMDEANVRCYAAAGDVPVGIVAVCYARCVGRK